VTTALSDSARGLGEVPVDTEVAAVITFIYSFIGEHLPRACLAEILR